RGRHRRLCGYFRRTAPVITGRTSAEDAEGLVAVTGRPRVGELLEPLLALLVALHHAARDGGERVAVRQRRRVVDLARHRGRNDGFESLGLGRHERLVALLE